MIAPMRSAWLVVLVACGGSPKSAAPMPAAAPTTVATSDPAPPPPGIAPDPCEGGEITPASGGGGAVGGEGAVIGHGAGTGMGGGNPCGKQPRGPAVALATPTVSGPLDVIIVRRYIRRHQAKLRYCFQRELARLPSLAGTVTATFEIGGDGLVSTSAATGLAGVDRCVADAIKAIEFPKPAATTTVTFPFVFRPAS